MQHLPVSIAVVIKADTWAVAGAQRGVHDGSDLCAGQHFPASPVAAHWTLKEGVKTGEEACGWAGVGMWKRRAGLAFRLCGHTLSVPYSSFPSGKI